MSFVAIGDGKKEENKESEKDRIQILSKEIFGEEFKNGLSDDENFAEVAGDDDDFGEIDFQIDEIGKDNQFESKL